MKINTKLLCGMVCLLTVFIAGCGSGDRVADVLELPVDGSGNGFTAEGAGADNSAAGEEPAVFTSAGGVITASEMFTERDWSGEYDLSEAEEILLSEGDVTITGEGVYLLRGALTDAVIIVDADKKAKIQLVFDGVEIENDTGAAVYVREADKVFITLAEGSENSLTSRGYTAMDGNNIDGVIYAKSDLTINGTGSLAVNAVSGHGIVTKDDLKITGGEIAVTAEKQGLSGRDSVRVGSGSISIISGRDGIHAENDGDDRKGFVYISGGTLQIASGGDGISAGSVIQVDGGEVDITAGGGSSNRTAALDDDGDTVSAKGIKAAGELVINQVTLSIDAQDDAIHSDSDVVINSGEMSLATGDDGIHADDTVTVAGGVIHISDSYEGIEGDNVEISGGVISLYARDDGLNAAGGNDGSGFGGMFGGGESFGHMGNRGPGNGNAGRENAGNGNAGAGGGNEVSHIQISGGVICVHAEGDGLDSNGDLLVSGGEVYVSGPENGANGALDYDGNGQITGGTVVAAGNSAMAMNFGAASTQGAILLTTASHPAGTAITLKDTAGRELVSYTAESAFNSVVISCPELEAGGAYTVTAGEEGAKITLGDGLIYGLIYGSGSGMGGFDHGGRAPGEDGRGDFGNGDRMPGGDDMGGFGNGGRAPGEDGGMGGFGSGGRMPDGVSPEVF